MKISIGSDHAGFAYKEQIKTLLTSLGHEVRDFGTDSAAPVDDPAFIRPAADAVARGECERGLVLGGSGNGEAIVANKPPFFILNHDLLLRLAHEAELIKNIERVLPPKMSSRRREGILLAITHGKNLPETDLPHKRVNILYQPTLAEQKRFMAMRQIRDKRAVELEIDPTLIASRSTLVLLSQDWDKYKVDLMAWQRELLSGPL